MLLTNCADHSLLKSGSRIGAQPDPDDRTPGDDELGAVTSGAKRLGDRNHIFELAKIHRIRENIRKGGYRPNEYTHEVVAEIYAMLIGRRCRNGLGRPEWLNDEIYKLVMRVTGWTP
jgi:hypothetical protein